MKVKLFIDEHLNWKPHLQNWQNKLSHAVGIIAKMRRYLNNKNLIALYYVFFHSHILYGIGWGSATKTAPKPIQILQNKVLRIINKTTWQDRISIDRLYQKHKLLKVADVYKYELGKFMYLYNVKALPEIFDNYFLSLNQYHDYNTRNKTNKHYFLNSVRTNSGKKFITFYGANYGTKFL